MATEKNTNRSYELRSEKVRSIVGQIPSPLIRYGTTAITLVLVLLLTVAYLLPYKQVYSGVATIKPYEVSTQTDSVKTLLLLKFDSKRPTITEPQTITLQTENRTIVGTLNTLSPIRDTLDRQQALCSFVLSDLTPIINQNTDFILTIHSGRVLNHLFQKQE